MPSVGDREELELLAARISIKVWQKLRRLIRKQQRELDQELEDDDDG